MTHTNTLNNRESRNFDNLHTKINKFCLNEIRNMQMIKYAQDDNRIYQGEKGLIAWLICQQFYCETFTRQKKGPSYEKINDDKSRPTTLSTIQQTNLSCK